jgi:HK97 family phage prohead protease
MDKKIFFFGSTFKAASQDDGSIIIEGLASTSAVDRVGDVITPDAWTKSGGIDNFKKNPIILFNHSYSKPIGKAIEIHTSAEGLFIKAKISKASGDVGELIKDGVLGAFSVGFMIKDAEYISETNGLKITDAELFEVSVVSIPANQDAVFSLAKSFDTTEQYKDFIKSINGLVDEEEAADAAPLNTSAPGDVDKNTTIKEMKQMDPKELEALMRSVAETTAKTMAEAQAKVEAERAAAVAAATAAKAADEALTEKVRVEVVTGAERLVADIEKRFADKSADLEKIVEGLKGEIAEKAGEINALRESKRHFADGNGNKKWQETFAKDMDEAYILGLATSKNWQETKFGKELITKVNTQAGVQVSSQDFEQIVSTNVERDIQNELILAPLFREIAMNAASMILPILPDAGYAEFTANQTASGISKSVGNLDVRGNAYGSPYSGVTMTERILTTKKLISRSYIGNETEEDAILPILPLIRESMIRSHARAVEASILVGNHADGPFGVAGASYDGLIKIADDDSNQAFLSGNLATSVMTAAQLLAARKNLGKYGVRADDVIYIVSQKSYFELLEDVEFQDMNLVGNMATKINGQVGQVFGSKVMICDEFKTKTNSVFCAAAVYTRNYIRPRLRGLTVESDYSVEEQRRVLVASQRLGFLDLFDAAPTVWALQYPAS